MIDPHHSSPITHHPVLRLLAAGLVLALCAAVGGCGMVNWSISNSGDGCPKEPRSTVPCP